MDRFSNEGLSEFMCWSLSLMQSNTARYKISAESGSLCRSRLSVFVRHREHLL